MNKIDLAEAAIGQGKVLVSPLHMAMITSAIANEGVMMEPVLVKSITNSEGKTTKELKPVKLGNVMEKSVAEKIK